MEVSKIYDFTNLLNEKGNTYNFNPSIARWKDKLYLCAYRSFMRYDDVLTQKYKNDPLNDPNHPWLGGNNSTTWWKTVDGYDETGFLMLTSDKRGIVNVKNYNDGKSIYFSDGYKTNLTKIKAIDSRLLHLTQDFFLLSYNTWTKNNIKIKQTTCDKSGCFIIATRLVKIVNDGLVFYKENIMCPLISNTTEKNWSFWVYQDSLFFSYGLSPNHTVYKSDVNFTTGEIRCMPFQPNVENPNLANPNLANPRLEKNGYYGKIEQEYNKNLPEKLFHISVTTPSIPKFDEPNRYIGVGHVKYKNDSRLLNLVQQSPLNLFYNKTKNFKRHPIFDYLMFIYEFDPVSAEITKITDFFIPIKTDYMLAFPSGLAYTPTGNLLISYGDHDSLCKLMVVQKDIINKILKPIVSNPQGTIFNPLPIDVKFFTFPETCFDKAGICSLVF